VNNLFGFIFGTSSRAYITRIISEAESGNLEALDRLLRILKKKAKGFPPNRSSNEGEKIRAESVDTEISSCLLRIFFSSYSRPEQKN